MKFEKLADLYEYLNNAEYVRVEYLLPHGITGSAYISLEVDGIEQLDDGLRFISDSSRIEITGDFTGAVGHPLDEEVVNITAGFEGQLPVYFLILKK